MRVILLGPPGSGKGTQGERVDARFGFPRVSTGDLLRAAEAAGTPLGLQAREAMNSGGLVSDDIVVNMVRERIGRDDCRKGYCLDGFPRTIPQAEKLEEMDSLRPEVVIDIRLDDEEIVERLSARRICSCGTVYNLRSRPPAREGRCDVCGAELLRRPDDEPDVIRERLRVYRERTRPLIERYRGRGRFHEVNGAREIEAVFRDIRSILDRAVEDEGH